MTKEQALEKLKLSLIEVDPEGVTEAAEEAGEDEE